MSAKTLFDYQQKIVDLQTNPASALFMDMGTGKTVTSLALFKKWKCPKILIICLVSKLEDWKKDLMSECSVEGIILDKGSKSNMCTVDTNPNAMIINFESAWRCHNLLQWVDKDTFVLIDESHKIKTHNSKIGKFCDKLSKRTPYKVILTGTPQSKGYIDYYSQLKFVDILKMSYKDFCNKYCVYQQMKFNGYPFNKLVGYQNTDELDKIMKERTVSGFVVGLPRQMNGQEGSQAELTRKWVSKLEKRYGLPVLFWDERWSSSAVSRVFVEQMDLSRNRQKALMDKTAAAYILQGALDLLSRI